MKNVDRIRLMSNEELAEDRVARIVEDDGTLRYYTSEGNYDNLQEAIANELKWLTEEVK